MKANMGRLVDSSVKMFKTSMITPWRSRSVLIKSLLLLGPVLRQVRRSGYIFAFQLPLPFVRTLGRGGNYSFLKAVHRQAAGINGKYTLRDAQESMASTLGPGLEECKSVTADREQYPPAVHRRAATGNFVDTVSYYRDGAATGEWLKSLETISTLYNIWPDRPRRTSSGAVFDAAPNSLKGNVTIVWGKLDTALDPHLALEGMGDYLVHGSQLVMLPRTGHFSPIEPQSRVALRRTVEWAIKGEKDDLAERVTADYPDATMAIRK